MFPNVPGNVLLTASIPSEEDVVPGYVDALGYEEEPTADPWFVTAYALCAYVS